MIRLAVGLGVLSYYIYITYIWVIWVGWVGRGWDAGVGWGGDICLLRPFNQAPCLLMDLLYMYILYKHVTDSVYARWCKIVWIMFCRIVKQLGTMMCNLVLAQVFCVSLLGWRLGRWSNCSSMGGGVYNIHDVQQLVGLMTQARILHLHFGLQYIQMHLSSWHRDENTYQRLYHIIQYPLVRTLHGLQHIHFAGHTCHFKAWSHLHAQSNICPSACPDMKCVRVKLLMTFVVLNIC